MTDGGKSRLESTPQEKKNIPLTGGAKAEKLSVASLSKTLARTGKHHHSCVTHEYIDEAKYSGKLQYVSYSNGFKKNIFFKRTIVHVSLFNIPMIKQLLLPVSQLENFTTQTSRPANVAWFALLVTQLKGNSSLEIYILMSLLCEAAVFYPMLKSLASFLLVLLSMDGSNSVSHHWSLTLNHEIFLEARCAQWTSRIL